MKRLLLIFIAIAFLFPFNFSPALAEKKTPSVFIDGLPVSFDVQPTLKNGRLLVPFRAIAEALNIEVNWDGSNQKITAIDQNNYVQLQIANSSAYRNEALVSLEVAPQIINGKTLIPLRFFSEAFACKVSWNSTDYQVDIISPPKPMKIAGFYALGDSKTSSWTNLFGSVYPEAAKGNTDLVDQLFLGWYSIDQQGNLMTNSRTGWQRPAGWEDVLTAAEEYKLNTEMVIHVTNVDGTIANLIANTKATNKAIDLISKESAMYSGVNLNFEGLGLSETGEKLLTTQAQFSAFASQLSKALHQHGKSLTLTLHAPNSVYQGYDFKVLGEIADLIVIMAYDYGPKPEPINSVNQAVEMALQDIAPEKLLLGISVPYETADSLLPKIGVAKKDQLAGIALWRLGLVSEEMWDVLRNNISP